MHTVTSVSENGMCRVMDIRAPCCQGGLSWKAYNQEVNLAYNPVQNHVLATGSSDGTVVLWNIRNTLQKLHTMSTLEPKVPQGLH